MFSKRLYEAMSLRNISQSELSRKTGIGKSSISQYLSGEYKAKQDKVFLLAKALNVDPGWLLGNEVENYDLLSDTNLAFESPEDAVSFLFEQKIIAADTGIDINQLSDEDKITFANRLLDYARFAYDDTKRNK